MALKSKELNKLHKFKQKARLINLDIKFLKQCKYKNVFPKFIKINIPIKNKTTEKVIINAKLDWLRLEIKNMYAKQQELELQSLEQHLYITKDLNILEMNYFNEKYQDILDSIEYKFNKKQITLNKKLLSLTTNVSKDKNNSTNIFQDDILVKNESSYHFTPQELNLLDKGLNFNLKSQQDLKNVIVDVESSIQYLNENKKNLIRTDIESKIINTNLIRTNDEQNQQYHKTISSLKSKDVFYLKADKSNTIVILDKNEYLNRVTDMLNSGPYILQDKNPLAKYISSTTFSLKQCKTLINQDLIKHLYIPNPNIPRLYCLPKIHKPGKNMRPIVNTINSPCYNLSKWLTQMLQNLNPYPSLAIKNRFEFINSIKNIKLQEDEIMISFDVTSLYPNIPIKETMKFFEKWFNSINLSKEETNEYLILINNCMNQNIFQFNGKFYQQTEGTAMGNPLSCFIANLFMGYFETNAKEKLPYFPRCWLRYVDDVFTIFNKNQDLNNFLNQLNSFYPTIKFTYETESNSKLPFLDVLLTRNENSQLIDFDIYRKPTHTNRFITNDSYHPPSQKRAAFNNMVYRLLNTPLNQENYNKELCYIKNIAIYNGYDCSLIDNIIKKSNKRKIKNSRSTLKNIKENEKKYWASFTYDENLSKTITKSFKKNSNIIPTYKTNNKLKNKLNNPKDKIKNENQAGIYEIKCNDCEEIYIGQTKRNLKIRYKEHFSHIKYNREEKSAVAKHCLQNSHTISKDNSKIIKVISNPKDLNAWETYFINKTNSTLMNNENGPIQNSRLLSKYFINNYTL